MPVETCNAVMQTDFDAVESSLRAVLPGVAVRGSFLGMLFAGFAYTHLFWFWEWSSGPLGAVEPYRTVVVVGVVPATVVVVTGLAVGEYSRRRYEFGSDQLTEHRGVVRTRSKSIAYEAIDSVHLTQTTLQNAFGVGTVRINRQTPEETDETMWLRFIRRPEQVYERLCADRADAMPRLTVEPDPAAAARTSAFRGVAVGVIGGFVPVVVVAAALGEVGVPVGQGLAAGVGALLYAIGARVAVIYTAYDSRQYDVYTDRAENVGRVSTTGAAYDDVETAELYAAVGGFGLVSEQDPDRTLGGNRDSESEQTTDSDSNRTRNDESNRTRNSESNRTRNDESNRTRNSESDATGRIELLDEDGETLVSFRYLSETERLWAQLESLL